MRKFFKVFLFCWVCVGLFGTAEARDINQLIRTAANDRTNDKVREKAFAALEKIGPSDVGLVPKIVLSLKHKDSAIRRLAIDVLARIGPGAKKAVLPLTVVYYQDLDYRVSGLAFWALTQILPLKAQGHPELLSRFKEGHEIVTRISAGLQMLRNRPLPKVAIPSLIDILENDKRPVMRSLAANLLGGVNLVPNPAQVGDRMAALRKAFQNDKSRTVRAAALCQLGSFSEENAKWIHNALEWTLLKDKMPGSRACAAWSFLHKEKGKASIQLLLRVASKDVNPAVRAHAVHSLGSKFSDYEKVFPVLTKMLHKDSNGFVRVAAANALEILDFKNGRSIPHLVDAVKTDRDPDVRIAAAEAINHISMNIPDKVAHEVVPTFLKRLKKDKNGMVRSVLARGLGHFVSFEQEILAGLKDALMNDSVRFVRSEAAYALPYGKKWLDPEVVESLIKAWESEKVKSVKVAIAESLGFVGYVMTLMTPAIKGGLDIMDKTLTKAVGESDESVQEAVQAALERIQLGQTLRLERGLSHLEEQEFSQRSRKGRRGR